MHFNGGTIERLVRFLVGLPVATAYTYVRHFNMTEAYALLAVGLTVMATGLLGQATSGRVGDHSKAPMHFPQTVFSYH